MCSNLGIKKRSVLEERVPEEIGGNSQEVGCVSGGRGVVLGEEALCYPGLGRTSSQDLGIRVHCSRHTTVGIRGIQPI